MLWRTIQISFRNILRNKLSGIIGILGFAIGFTICLILGIYIYKEFSVDKYHTKYERIYRVVDSEHNYCNLIYDLNEVLRENYAAIENSCPVEMQSNLEVDVYTENKSLYIKGILTTDNHFFDIFSVNVIQSLDSKYPFTDAQSSIITESAAKNIFGEATPLGKPLNVSGKQTVVSAIIEDFSSNSSFSGNIILNSKNPNFRRSLLITYDEDKETMHYLAEHYILLNEAYSKAECEKNINSTISSYFKSPKNIFIQPLTEIYFNTSIRDSNRHGDKKAIVVLGLVGTLILLLSITNYINYITALQLDRLNVIGVKKTVGAKRVQLLTSFLIDTFLWVLIAFGISLLFVGIAIPWFNNIFDQQLSLKLIYSKPIIMGTIFSLMCVVLISVFPILLLLSRFKLINFLRKDIFSDQKSRRFNPLSIFQLAASFFLIVGVIVISKQMNYIKHKNLGFDDSALMYIHVPYNALNAKSFKDELLKHPNIENVTLSSGIPGVLSQKKSRDEWSFLLSYISIDKDFLPTMGINLLEGQELDEHDPNSCLVNKTLLKELQINDYQGKKIDGKNIVGVVEDFHFASLHEKIEPLQLLVGNRNERSVSLRISGDGISAVLTYINTVWQEMTENVPLHYYFYDSWFDSLYKKEEQMSHATSIISLIAIVITCLGLLGQIHQTTKLRTKELGIRKVNGAKIHELFSTLNRELLLWIGIASLIATPLAWYFMNKWLEEFAYRIDISWWIFALSGIITLAIALLTVSLQSWRAASRNPVEALRYE